MPRLIALLTLFASGAAFADEVNVPDGLQPVKKKASWSIKGKAMDPYMVAELANRRNDPETSIPAAIASLELQPGGGQALRELTRGYAYAGQMDQAFNTANWLVSLYPDQRDAWLELLWVSPHTRPADEVEGIAKDAASRFPTDQRIQYAASLSLLSVGHPDEAEALLDHAETQESHEFWSCARTRIAVAKGDQTKASEQLEVCEDKAESYAALPMAAVAALSGDFKSAAKRASETQFVGYKQFYSMIRYNHEGRADMAMRASDWFKGPQPYYVALEVALTHAYNDADDASERIQAALATPADRQVSGSYDLPPDAVSFSQTEAQEYQALQKARSGDYAGVTPLVGGESGSSGFGKMAVSLKLMNDGQEEAAWAALAAVDDNRKSCPAYTNTLSALREMGSAVPEWAAE